jgi:hypothetical protein
VLSGAKSLADLRFAKLDVSSDDFLLFKTDCLVTSEQATLLRKQIKAMLPLNTKFALLTYPISVMKLHKKDVPLDWNAAWENGSLP